MTNEERDLIIQFIRRAGGAPAAGAGFGSVPATQPAAEPLPPVDREADALIADLFARYPEARYRITQMAFIQEHALAEAQNQINRLQWELTQARQQQQAQQAPASPWGAAAQPQEPSRGFFGGLFGGGRQAAPPPPPQQYAQAQYAPPPPQYAPGYQPGMFQQRGSGFLGSALTTAAGVAGGMVVGNMLMNAFSGGGHAHAASLPTADAGGSAWTPTAAPDPYAIGGEPKDTGWTQSGSGWDSARPVSYEEDQGDSGWSDAGSDDEI